MNWRSLLTRGLCGSLLVACGGQKIVEVVGQAPQTQISIGQELDVKLGNVGPAEYASPPLISSGVLTFLDVGVVPPYTPAGPIQQFRFRGVSQGLAIVTFKRMLDTAVVSVVVDTVVVR